jgi:hypothetical protein
MFDKWMTRGLLLLPPLALLGFGALSGYCPGPRTWQDGAASAVSVALALGWGIAMGLQIHEKVRSNLMTWAYGTERQLAEEETEHEALIGLLRENVHDSNWLQTAVRRHLLALDAPRDEDPHQEGH